MKFDSKGMSVSKPSQNWAYVNRKIHCKTFCILQSKNLIFCACFLFIYIFRVLYMGPSGRGLHLWANWLLYFGKAYKRNRIVCSPCSYFIHGILYRLTENILGFSWNVPCHDNCPILVKKKQALELLRMKHVKKTILNSLYAEKLQLTHFEWT